jgi:ABC-type nitrate/sulfonate/bicarbonate transport system ATPase subunit
MTLEVHHLSHTFRNGAQSPVRVLQDISLTVAHREIVGVVGPSGCGKTTLLECIAGLLMPEQGTILFNGNSIVGSCDHAAYMTQADVMLPWRNVLDNVILPLELVGQHTSSARVQSRHLLQQFKLDQFSSFHPADLSGGMRQRVSLLRAYAAQKNLWLLDEPFAKLDALTRLEIQNWFLANWERCHPAVLLVTHDVEEALYCADRVLALSPRPGHAMADIKVTLPRPRTPALTATSEFNQLKVEILGSLGIG